MIFSKINPCYAYKHQPLVKKKEKKKHKLTSQLTKLNQLVDKNPDEN